MAETSSTPSSPTASSLRLTTDQLRWRCDPSTMNFDSTANVEPFAGVVGQDDAVEALRFGLETFAPGQNVYVRGLSGTGRLTVVSRLLEEIQPACRPAADYAYIHNFAHRDRPKLLVLPRGQGRLFLDMMNSLIEFIRDDLGSALSSDTMQSRRQTLTERLQAAMEAVAKPFDEELRQSGLTMVAIQVGQAVQQAMVPLIDGAPAPPERLEQLRNQGDIGDEEIEKIQKTISGFSKRFQEVGKELNGLQRKHAEDVRTLFQSEARALLDRLAAEIIAEFPQVDVKRFLDEVVKDVAERRLKNLQEKTEFTRLYEVNLVLEHDEQEPCPIIVENTPTLQNLLGATEREILPGGLVRSDHLMINAGSLLRAQGGYLVLEARDLLQEPGAWKVLVRTLRTRVLEMVPPDSALPFAGTSLKPESIPLEVKVVLIGDPGLYHLLDDNDPDFPHLFKVLADFDDSIDRGEKSIELYAGLLARIVEEEDLPHFESSAVAALAEYGARIAGRSDRLTTRFGRLVDIAREAAFLTGKGPRSTVTNEEVLEAVRRSRRRADLPARRFRGLVTEGTIRIQTHGSAIGQVNGLAVINAGPLTYGFPARITATIGPGTAGTINIEREAQLSGAIHTKGFYILGGLLRHLLRTEHPLAFSASVAFEQSYGGIDGDSASGAEMCCLLSALTGVPLRQDLAMTGAIDQLGHIEPIGAVTEKIEGFYDTCKDVGLTGTQGVIIPRSNVRNLMLRLDLVEACDAGMFHVYAVETIHEALEVFTGRTAGELDGEGEYPEGTLLHVAVQKAFGYWLLAARPASAEWLAAEEEEEQEESAG